MLTCAFLQPYTRAPVCTHRAPTVCPERWGDTGDGPARRDSCPATPSDTLISLVWVGGRLAGSVSGASDFGSGHDLLVREFEPHIRLTAVSEEPASDHLSPPPLYLSPAQALALSLSLKNKSTYKKNLKKI